VTPALYRFVNHREVDAYLADGWIPTLPAVPCHHDRHSVLMRACACYEKEKTDEAA
jgi:hypothetical protein